MFTQSLIAIQTNYLEVHMLQGSKTLGSIISPEDQLDEWRCPITGDVFLNPVRISCISADMKIFGKKGHVFEEQAIKEWFEKEWFEKKKTCPCCRQELESIKLTVVPGLKSKIKAFFRANPHLQHEQYGSEIALINGGLFSRNKSVLEHAFEFNNFELVKQQLVLEEDNINLQSKGQSFLESAVEHGWFEMVNVLLNDRQLKYEKENLEKPKEIAHNKGYRAIEVLLKVYDQNIDERFYNLNCFFHNPDKLVKLKMGESYRLTGKIRDSAFKDFLEFLSGSTDAKRLETLIDSKRWHVFKQPRSSLVGKFKKTNTLKEIDKLIKEEKLRQSLR